MGAHPAPDLVLGPVLRYVGTTEATVWVETDVPCEVEILGRASRTFEVCGHHYALVVVRGLRPGTAHEYRVRLDGHERWPDPAHGLPPSVIRTLDPRGTTRVVFGSCRLAHPHRPPYTWSPDRDPQGRGIDACWAYAERLCGQRPEELPDLFLHLGDQVYADEPSPAVAGLIRARRRDAAAPARHVLDFEEYAALYHESWGSAAPPSLRWLLSTVPHGMIFDDHEIHDDWNTSQTWLETMRAQPWWEEHLTSGLMSYWVYQHAGNLAADALEADPLWVALRSARGDGGPLLRRFAARAHIEPWGAGAPRWGYRRDLGAVRLVVIDSRARRVLEPDRRDMLDPAEWRWVDDAFRGDFGHLLVATSLPFLLPRAVHQFERWSERVSAGAWGARAAALGERLRQDLDLEHWAAFGRGFDRLAALLGEVATRRSSRPASIACLSGDVHFGYLAEAGLPGSTAPISQVVCSPMRNPLARRMRWAFRASDAPLLAGASRALARAAGAAAPSLDWRLRAGPWFGNMIARLELGESSATLVFEEATEEPDPRLRTVLRASLAPET